MTTTTISALRANIKQYIDSVMTNHETVIINRGNSGAVLISLDEYNSIMATEKVLKNRSIASKLDKVADEDTIEVDINDL